MSITLNLTSYHRLSPGQSAQKVFGKEGGSIGRSPDCEWCLPDPEKIISSKHLAIQYDNGNYFVVDNSTNGLFINRAVEPLGRGNSIKLEEGLHLALGDYEIVVESIGSSTAEIAVSQSKNRAEIPKATKAYAVPANKSKREMRAKPSTLVTDNIAPEVLGIKSNANTSFAKPVVANRKPLATNSMPTESVALFGDSTGFQGDEHFEAPNFIPGNWDDELLGGVDTSTSTSAIATSAEYSHPSVDTDLPEAPPLRPSFNANIPRAQAAKPRVVTAASNQSTISASVVRRAPENACSSGAMNAFFYGLNVKQDSIKIESEEAFFEELGVVVRGLLQGVLDTLASRSSLKNEFRVLQTTIRPNENNPLKFSATVDDAMRNLFGNLGGSFLLPKQAVGEAFQDINRHQVALLSGTQGALLELLRYIQPHEIERRSQLSNGLVESVIPAVKKAKNWDFFQEMYRDLMKDAEGDSPKLFAMEFAKAYEQQLKKFD